VIFEKSDVFFSFFYIGADSIDPIGHPKLNTTPS